MTAGGGGKGKRLLMKSHMQEFQKSSPTTLLEIIGVPTHANTSMTGLGRVKMQIAQNSLWRLTRKSDFTGVLNLHFHPFQPIHLAQPDGAMREETPNITTNS